jgi:hypothetical protein
MYLSANARKDLLLQVGRWNRWRGRHIEGTVHLPKLLKFTLATGTRIHVLPDLSGGLELESAQDEGCQVVVYLRARHLMASREVPWTASSLRKLL